MFVTSLPRETATKRSYLSACPIMIMFGMAPLMVATPPTLAAKQIDRVRPTARFRKPSGSRLAKPCETGAWPDSEPSTAVGWATSTAMTGSRASFSCIFLRPGCEQVLWRIQILFKKDLTRFAIQRKGSDGMWTRKPLAYRESNIFSLCIIRPPEICVDFFKHIHAA